MPTECSPFHCGRNTGAPRSWTIRGAIHETLQPLTGGQVDGGTQQTRHSPAAAPRCSSALSIQNAAWCAVFLFPVDGDGIRSSVSPLRPEDPGHRTIPAGAEATPPRRWPNARDGRNLTGAITKFAPKQTWMSRFPFSFLPTKTAQVEERVPIPSSCSLYRSLPKREPQRFARVPNPRKTRFQTHTNGCVTRGAGGNRFFFTRTRDAPIPLGASHWCTIASSQV